MAKEMVISAGLWTLRMGKDFTLFGCKEGALCMQDKDVC